MIRGDWTWAEGPKHGATTQRAKQYIDFAAKNGFSSVLIEGWDKGWNGNWLGTGGFQLYQSADDFDLEAVTAYGHKKGVNIIGHHETGGNIANYEAQLDDAMKLYNRLGVPAVKTGYVADAGGIQAPCGSNPTKICMEYHDGQRQVQHHLRVVQTAAQYHIAVNAHEPVKDTGLRRTYPNWIAREARAAWNITHGAPSPMAPATSRRWFTPACCPARWISRRAFSALRGEPCAARLDAGQATGSLSGALLSDPDGGRFHREP
jgi:alpha-glucosidase